jgi:hypothetical protein
MDQAKMRAVSFLDLRVARRAVVVGASIIASTLATTSQAATLFEIDPNPSQKIAVNLDNASGVTTGFGTVVSKDDVAISVTGAADFAGGDAAIKALSGSRAAKLTDLLFTPTDPTEFDAFSFRGQDLVGDQSIKVIVTDQSNQTESFFFTIDKAHQDFSRIGIIADLAGETIKSVEIMNSGGFKEAKQFAFETVPPVTGGVPEPATWASLVVGFGLMGAVIRRSRRASAAI